MILVDENDRPIRQGVGKFSRGTEYEIKRMAIIGLRAREIAEKLNISYWKVLSHMKNNDLDMYVQTDKYHPKRISTDEVKGA